MRHKGRKRSKGTYREKANRKREGRERMRNRG